MNRWGVVGLTNQPAGPPGGQPQRSRGLLVLDALAEAGPRPAVELARDPGLTTSQQFNLFAIDGQSLEVAYHRGAETVIETLDAGWHVLPNGRADDRRIPKVLRSFELLAGLPCELEPHALAGALRRILADHQRPEAAPDEPAWLPEELRQAIGALCVHSEFYGTRSYSILMVGEGERHYWHGEGPPCTAELAPVSI